MFPGPLGESLAGKALKEGVWRLEAVDIRRFAKDRHGTVDDAPFGGGAGMVMKPDVLSAALSAVAEAPGMAGAPKLLLSPRGDSSSFGAPAIPGASATAESAADSTSGFITMPAPPPKGASSTVPWRSLANRLMSTASSRHTPSFNALPARLSPSGPGNISGKSESAVARHTLSYASFASPPASTPAGGSTVTLPPATSISGTTSSVKGSITEPRDAPPPETSIVRPAPKSWKAKTL